MRWIQGIVTIVQEGRFQLVDQDGVGHHFLLSHNASLEPEQLPQLQRDQSLVRVWLRRAPDVIGHVAARIDLLAGDAPNMPRQSSQAATSAAARMHESI